MRSVASLFVSRWDVAVAHKVPAELRNTLGIAVSKQSYEAYRDVLESDRFQRLTNVGALARDGGDANAVLLAYAKAGIDLTALAAQLQCDGATGFVASWRELLAAIDAKSKVLA